MGTTDTVAKVEPELTNWVDLQIFAEDYNTGNSVGSNAFTIQQTYASEFNGVYDKAYCLGLFAPVNPGGFRTDIHDAYGVGSLVTVADEDYLTDDHEGSSSHTGINGKMGLENLDLINWIVNQDFEETDNGDGTSQSYRGAEVQGAIWALTNGEQLKGYGETEGVYVDAALGTVDNAQQIVDLALVNGEGFEAG